jgi:hypothetical protein
MRYRVRGLEIRSENAAKPGSSAGRWMLEWISSLKREGTALDLGCGKLRYTVPPAARVRRVVAVDSKVQVERKQIVCGTSRSVREYARQHLANVRICAVEECTWKLGRHETVLCSNVLSAVPSPRTRRELLTAAFNCLKADGRFLVTTQYRNSHFTKWRADDRAEPFYDGFLVRGRRGTSFYGLIDSPALVKLCRTAGFSIVQTGHAEELAYVIATRD